MLDFVSALFIVLTSLIISSEKGNNICAEELFIPC